MLHCMEWTQYKDGLRFPVGEKYNYLLYCLFNDVSSSDYKISNGFFFFPQGKTVSSGPGPLHC